jgi:cytochrome c-type biogenesis protein CcmH/NrfF
MNERLTRRAFFGVAAAAASAAVQDTVSAGRVYDPSRAGRSREPTTAADNDAAIQSIEKRLKCSCGCGLDIYTCRTTDFTCTYSPALHKDVLRLAEQGKTGEQIIDEFVAQYGEAVLMAPPKRGFNLAGYFVPSLAVIVAAVLLVRVLRRWTRHAQAATAAGTAALDHRIARGDPVGHRRHLLRAAADSATGTGGRGAGSGRCG